MVILNARAPGAHESDQSRRGQLTMAAECAAKRETDIVISFKMEVEEIAATVYLPYSSCFFLKTHKEIYNILQVEHLL